MARHLALFIFLIPLLSYAEFGWMPPAENLDLKFGFESLFSSNNYNTNSDIVPIAYSGDLVKASETKIFLEPEYSFTNDWSGRLRLGFTTSSISSDTSSAGSYLSAAGIGNIEAAVKWRMRAAKPGIVLEMLSLLPTYGRTINFAGDMVLGDASVDLGIFLHTTYGTKRFFFALSPHLWFRTGGYSPRIGANVGAGVRFGPAFFMPVLESTMSIGNELLFDTSEFQHNPVGSGGSYLRLSGSPSWVTVGAKVGVKATDKFFVEGNFKTTTWGKRAASFWALGVSLTYRFDFFVPDTRTPVYEVPFESRPEVN